MLLTLYPLVFQQSNTVFVYLIGNQSSAYAGNITTNTELDVVTVGEGINLIGGAVSVLQSTSSILSANSNIISNGVLSLPISSIISPTGSLSNTANGVLNYSVSTQASIVSSLNSAYSSTLQVSPLVQTNAVGNQVVSYYGNIGFVVTASPVLNSYANNLYTSPLSISQNVSVGIASSAMQMTYGDLNPNTYAEVLYVGSSVEIQTNSLNTDYYITSVIEGSSNSIYAGNISAFEFIRSIFSKIEYPRIQWGITYKESDILQTDYVNNVFDKQERGIEWSKENHATLHLLRAEVEV